MAEDIFFICGMQISMKADAQRCQMLTMAWRELSIDASHPFSCFFSKFGITVPGPKPQRGPSLGTGISNPKGS